MTATTTPPAPADRTDPADPADLIVLSAPVARMAVATAPAPIPTDDDERPVTRVEHAWRVLLVAFLAFVFVGCLRLSVDAPDGAGWLSVAGVCLVAALVLSVLLIIQARRARAARPRHERGDSGYGRRVPLTSVFLVTVAVLVVVAFNYVLANLPASGIK